MPMNAETMNDTLAFPALLQGAAYISASGQVYRLFDDDEKKCAATFDCPPIIYPPFEVPKEEWNEKSGSGKLDDDLKSLEMFELKELVGTTAFGQEEQPVILSLAETVRKQRAVADIQLSESQRGTSTFAREKKSGGLAPQRLQLFEAIEPSEDWLPINTDVELSVAEPALIPFIKKEATKDIEDSENEDTEEQKTEKPITEQPTETKNPVSVIRWDVRLHRKSKPIYRKTDLRTDSRKTESANPAPTQDSVQYVDFQMPEQFVKLSETAANQVRSIADHLVVLMNQGNKTLCFNGFLQGDGCTTLLLWTVQEMTNRGYRIKLTEGNNRNPDLLQRLELHLEPEQTKGTICLSDNLVLSLEEEPKTPKTEDSGFDLELIDCGSLTGLPLAEHIEFLNKVKADGIVLILNTKNTPESSISTITKRLRRNQVSLLGIIENYV
ncbi:hypothetical protein FACS189443_3710 [Planctomycetales bacterium]|nr:hypothetical protein FACS189443_3710 [Planctomycetales bacterium]